MRKYIYYIAAFAAIVFASSCSKMMNEALEAEVIEPIEVTYKIDIDLESPADGSPVAAPTEWYNKLKYFQNDSYDSILKDEINTAVTGYYKTEHVFYCYPNPHLDDDFSSTWSERPTRLVVEAKINTLDTTSGDKEGSRVLLSWLVD